MSEQGFNFPFIEFPIPNLKGKIELYIRNNTYELLKKLNQIQNALNFDKLISSYLKQVSELVYNIYRFHKDEIPPLRRNEDHKTIFLKNKTFEKLEIYAYYKSRAHPQIIDLDRALFILLEDAIDKIHVQGLKKDFQEFKKSNYNNSQGDLNFQVSWNNWVYYYSIPSFLEEHCIEISLTQLFERSLKFYNQLSFKTKFRTAQFIIPTIVYIEAVNSHIFLSKKYISSYFHLKLTKFNHNLIAYYCKNKQIYKKHHSDQFRLLYIRALFKKYCDKYNFLNEHLSYMETLLKLNYNTLKNRSNSIIAILLLYYTKQTYKIKQLGKREITDFLDISPSVLSLNDDIIKKIKKKGGK